jgi:hypothetical protein
VQCGRLLLGWCQASERQAYAPWLIASPEDVGSVVGAVPWQAAAPKGVGSAVIADWTEAFDDGVVP